MNYGADESCAELVIRALHEADHDVLVVAGVARGTADEPSMKRAWSDKRVLITKITTSAWCMRAGALNGRRLGEVSQPSAPGQAGERGPAVVTLGWRLQNGFAVVSSSHTPGRKAARLMCTGGVDALLMGNVGVLYSNGLAIDAGLHRS
jgi:hypothetical protein